MMTVPFIPQIKGQPLAIVVPEPNYHADRQLEQVDGCWPGPTRILRGEHASCYRFLDLLQEGRFSNIVVIAHNENEKGWSLKMADGILSAYKIRRALTRRLNFLDLSSVCQSKRIVKYLVNSGGFRGGMGNNKVIRPEEALLFARFFYSWARQGKSVCQARELAIEQCEQHDPDALFYENIFLHGLHRLCLVEQVTNVKVDAMARSTLHGITGRNFDRLHEMPGDRLTLIAGGYGRILHKDYPIPLEKAHHMVSSLPAEETGALHAFVGVDKNNCYYLVTFQKIGHSPGHNLGINDTLSQPDATTTGKDGSTLYADEKPFAGPLSPSSLQQSLQMGNRELEIISAVDDSLKPMFSIVGDSLEPVGLIWWPGAPMRLLSEGGVKGGFSLGQEVSGEARPEVSEARGSQRRGMVAWIIGHLRSAIEKIRRYFGCLSTPCFD